VRCGRCSRRLLFLSSRFPSIGKSDSRQTVNKEGGKDYNGGIKRKCQKMGRLIQNCATSAAAKVKLAR
jgi:isopentenyl phosphate kinase